MSEFKNMKIEITDETHLKAVCDVLKDLGYKCEFITSSYVPVCIIAFADGIYCAYSYDVYATKTYTLASLLKIRDEMVRK